MIEHTALPMDTNVIWQAIWMPNRNRPAQYMRSTRAVKAMSSASGVKMCANRPGKSSMSSQSETE